MTKWPTLELVKRAHRATLEKFLREHNSTRQEKNDERISSIKASQPLTTDRAVITSSIPMIKALAEQMKVTRETIKEFDRQIEELCSSHQDYHLFESLPGSGTVYASRL